jgi:hypothetical protein
MNLLSTNHQQINVSDTMNSTAIIHLEVSLKLVHVRSMDKLKVLVACRQKERDDSVKAPIIQVCTARQDNDFFVFCAVAANLVLCLWLYKLQAPKSLRPWSLPMLGPRALSL